MLDPNYLIRDKGQIYSLHEESFDFIVHYDFDEVTNTNIIKEEHFFNKQFGEGQTIPIVAGKSVLMNQLGQSRN